MTDIVVGSKEWLEAQHNAVFSMIEKGLVEAQSGKLTPEVAKQLEGLVKEKDDLIQAINKLRGAFRA